MEWNLDRAEMVRLFGSTRDKWMEEDMEVCYAQCAALLPCPILISRHSSHHLDMQGWLSPNEIYEGIALPLQQALSCPHAETYIVTTKQV
jgi:hypothetical protein